MKVLVLGGSGYVGSRLCTLLSQTGWATPVSASRRAGVDTVDLASMKRAVQGAGAVVNCVAGSAAAVVGAILFAWSSSADTRRTAQPRSRKARACSCKPRSNRAGRGSCTCPPCQSTARSKAR